MKTWRVQYAFSKDISCPSIHRDERAAKGEVAYLLGTWLMKHLKSHTNHYARQGDHKLYVEQGKNLVHQVRALIAQDDVWAAYNMWHDFYDHFEHEFGSPLYIMIGTVLVEIKEFGGTSARRPLMQRGEVPPFVQEAPEREEGTTVIYGTSDELEAHSGMMYVFDKVVEAVTKANVKVSMADFQQKLEEVSHEVAREFGPEGEGLNSDNFQEFLDRVVSEMIRKLTKRGFTMGAVRWQVYYADIGGRWHPSVHTNENRAKGHLKDLLVWSIIPHMQKHAESELMFGDEEASERGLREYETAHLMGMDLDFNFVWRAYRRFRDWQDNLEPTPLFPPWMNVGTVRVIPEPEPEPEETTIE